MESTAYPGETNVGGAFDGELTELELKDSGVEVA